MKIINTLLLFFCFASALAQDDSTFNSHLDEVVVTATRSERKLSNVAVPTTIIQGKRITQSGSLRLNDILGEQTGLFITESFGKGLQMQGLSADYTLILLNGEPLIGRMGGVIDLSRIAVGNIKKIEIVKGPSSSLYGSEALAGVVNIITDQPAADRLSASLRYGRFNTLDASANGSIKRGKFSGSGFINSNSSEGYTLLPGSRQKTVEPFWRFTNQFQAAYDFSPRTKLSASLRYNIEDITNSITVQNLGQNIVSTGSEVNKDLNFNPVLSHQVSSRIKTQFRGYVSSFQSVQKLDVKDMVVNYNDEFNQQFYRMENQTDLLISDKFNMNVGGGYIHEGVSSNRYDSLSTRRSNNIGYAFVQTEWLPVKRLSVIGGMRFDANQAYASVLSPKLALRYSITEKISFSGSVGRGFKAPDFRQLYLNFTNVAAGSYSVFGSLVAQDEINMLVANNQIDVLTPSYYKLADLSPETSTGINAGFQYRPVQSLLVKLNAFRNDINNLILTDVIAFKKNGGQIFSYLNISRAFTQGIETEANWRKGALEFTAGYQFLQTADKDVLDDLKEGKVFTRDIETGVSRKMTRSQYAGLPNRSKHMANLRLFHEWKTTGWFATARAIWRSKWGTTDIDGNGVINREDEFARGFVQLNLSAGKNLRNGIRIMAGVDNVFNYKDEVNLPGQPGYNWYLTLGYDFMNKHKH
jgi:outer membrane receptor for ferrienterochelin and colicins